MHVNAFPIASGCMWTHSRAVSADTLNSLGSSLVTLVCRQKWSLAVSKSRQEVAGSGRRWQEVVEGGRKRQEVLEGDRKWGRRKCG